jgi:hypothetical protein
MEFSGTAAPELSAGNEPCNTEPRNIFYLSEIREDSILKLNRERNFSLFRDALPASANRAGKTSHSIASQLMNLTFLVKRHS